MEERSGFWSHIGGVVRFFVFMAVIALLAFFVVRWVRDRNTNQVADNTNVAQNDTKTNNEDNDKDDSKDESPIIDDTSDDVVVEDETDTTADDTNNEPDEVPSGIADDSGAGKGLNSGKGGDIAQVPSTGMGENIFLTIAMFAGLSYLLAKKLQYSKEIQSL